MEIFDKKYAGILLITSNDTVLMQKRDNRPDIKNPGMITSFGGSVEDGDTPSEAALRELKEEVSLDLLSEDLTLLKIFNKRKETHGEDVSCYIYMVKGVDPAKLDIHEGQGFVEIRREDDLSKMKLSRLAGGILEEYFRR
jgi:8-oxo-dGTP diphosphatase